MEGQAKRKSKQVDVKKLHRFKSFTERIANIRINVTHRSGHVAELTEEDQETFFDSALQKWRELNCTTDFVSFLRETHYKATSLAQLVHHKDEIAERLKHYLRVKNTLAYEPLLDLVVQLARDLQSDFYPYFKDFFPVLTSLTDTQDTDVIQCVFTSLAYLFKFLWRYMIKDIERVFKLHSELLLLSTKPHIRQFAVESFGFLLRKVCDQDGLFDMIFKHLSVNPDMAEGIGQLLFEIVKGVSKQFHSCTNDVLPLLLRKLGSPYLTSELVFQSLTKMVSLMAEYTRKEFAGSLWNPLLDHLSHLQTKLKTEGGVNNASLELSYTLHLVGIIVSWRRGTRMANSTAVVEAVMNILSEPSLDAKVLTVAIHLAASLILISPSLPECHAHVSKLVNSVCVGRVVKREEVKLVIGFFQELAEKYQEFEENILTKCVAYCDSVIQEKENAFPIMNLLKQLCFHFEPPTYSNKINSSRKFTIKVKGVGNTSRGGKKIVLFLSLIVAHGSTWIKENVHLSVSEGERVEDEFMEVDGAETGTLDQLLASVVILRHIRPLPQQTIDRLSKLYFHLREIAFKNEAMSGELVFLLSRCLSALVRVLSHDLIKLMDTVPLKDVLSLLKVIPASLPLLSSVEEYVSETGDHAPEMLSSDWLQEFIPVCQDNLTSPHPQVRLLTLKILCSFKQLPFSSEDQDTESSCLPALDILKLCLQVEELSTNLDTYRDKLLLCDKLKYRPQAIAPLTAVYREVALRYLIGLLYVNFNLIWEPVIEIIGSYAVEENRKVFWNVFGYFLEKASTVAESSSPASHSETKDSSNSIETVFKHELTGMESGRVDHGNFRLLLWKCVYSLNPSMAESRSRILVPLVLRFIKNEYSLQEDNLMDTQDLRKPCSLDQTDNQTPSVSVQSSSRYTRTLEQHTDTGDTRKGLYKTLTTMLSAFSKFKNPKTFYRNEEIKQLWMKLLTHKISEVQKLTLSCLMTYRPPHLLPYRENFERLLNDESFREELINFSSDSSCSVVSTEHREPLLPVLIRVLYGRMQKHGGGHESVSRRGSALRFLGSCDERDLAEFVNLLMLPFQEFKALPILHSEPQLVTMVTPSHVIPIKKQQGFLHMLGQMVSIIGSKIKSYLNVFFPVLLNMGAAYVSLLEQRHKIQPHFVSALKALRQLVISRISECYEMFLDYNLETYKEWVFLYIVWPQLSRLPQECLQSPTPLLKLLHTWTSHQQYFHLLNTRVPPLLSAVPSSQEQENGSNPHMIVDDPAAGTNIMDIVYSCLSSTGVSTTVCCYIMEMTTSLLDSEGVDQLLQGSDQNPELGGVELVKPFIPQLLKYINRSIRENLSKDKNGNLLLMEFALLSRISVFVNDTSQSTLLIQLLLPFLRKSLIKQKKCEEEILLALQNLVRHTDEVSSICRHLSELFTTISDRKCRGILCEIFMEMGNTDVQWTSTAVTLSMINSWDRKHIEEPDYEQRLKGFSEASSKLPSSEDNVGGLSWSLTVLNTTLPLAHNALFYLMQSGDMSIRDAAGTYVSNLIKHINPQDGEAFRVLILGATLNAVKDGLRSKAEFARHESISVLSQLVKTYSDHFRFSDLVPLSHAEMEADFFENVKHIQLHRRTRAFKKLAAVCCQGTVSQASYMNFLLPLASQVIFHPTTNVEQNLIGEAINVIGAISSHLSWSNYYFIITHYLRQLPKQIEIQRSLVKAVVAVLDNFHFDLSSITVKDLQVDCPPENDTTIKSVQNLSENESNPITTPDTGENDTEWEVEEKESAVDKETLQETSSMVTESVHEEKNKLFAKKILKTVLSSILPSLQGALTKRIDVAGHKLSSLAQNEDSEILRVPIALAMTKLLLALPEETLHAQLPSLLLKVCLTLKNRARDVRDVGRSTLIKMATSLGPKYLQFIIRQMMDTLTRGYMLHVLSYSLHSLLRDISSSSSTSLPVHLTGTLKSGDLDSCLELISSILVEDLFGVPAEERESGENVAKIPESKTPQSFNCYDITARYLTPKLLPDFMAPVRQILETQCTARAVRVVEEIFRRVGLGIQANEGFTPQSLLVFVHRVLSDSIPQLATKPRPKIAPPTNSLVPRPPDSRLLPPTPERAGVKVAMTGNSGANVVTEFGLQLLYIALKRGKFDTSSKEQLEMLDPFVSLLSDSLTSRHVRVLSRALQCLVWIVRMALPSLDLYIDILSTHLFELLRRYARAGAAVGSNKELVLSAFKAMTVILRDFKKYTASEDELKLLLSFVEEDIHDHQRQSTAFPLLKAILVKKLVVSETYDVMHKVSQLSVTADSDHVRQQCRQVMLQFLMDYPLGKKLSHYLDFYISNLSYERQSGRESVLELFSSMFNKFPERILYRHSGYFFVPLSSRLINDESPTCRQMVSATIKLLLKRLDSTRINDVVTMVTLWLNSDNLVHRRLGTQIAGLLIEVEGQSFEKRVSTLLPLFNDCLRLYDPSLSEEEIVRSVARNARVLAESHKVKHDGDSDKDISEEDVVGGDDDLSGGDSDSEEVQDIDLGDTDSSTNSTHGGETEVTESTESEVTLATFDHLLFAVLCTVRKLFEECTVIRAVEFSELMNELWSKVQTLLLHPHAWIRLAAGQLYGLLFAAYTPDDLVDLVTRAAETKKKRGRKSKGDVKQKHLNDYLLQDTVSKVQDLCNAFCMQLWSPLLSSQLASQAVKNLVFGAKVIHRFQLSGAVVSDANGSLSKDSQSDERIETADGDQGDGLQGKPLSQESSRGISWLVNRLSRLARFEAGHHPKEAQKRTCVLQWTAAVCVDLGREYLPPYLSSMLGPLYRELADSYKRAGDELHTLAQEVVVVIKNVCGRDVFSRGYAQVHQSVLDMRGKRRKQAALEAVADPEKSIRRKHKKNELKKASKKMKILLYRPDSTAAVIANKRRKQGPIK